MIFVLKNVLFPKFCNLLMPLSNLAKSPFVVLTSGYRKVKTSKLRRLQKKKPAALMAGFSVMKALASLKKSVQQSKTLKRVIGSLFPVSAAEVPVKIARNSCMHTVVMKVAGLWVI